MGGYTTIASMRGTASGQGTIPTQTFNATNIIGTPVPTVGDSRGVQSFAGSVGQVVDPKHVVVVAVAVIAGGYLLYHFNFEK